MRVRKVDGGIKYKTIFAFQWLVRETSSPQANGGDLKDERGGGNGKGGYRLD